MATSKHLHQPMIFTVEELDALTCSRAVSPVNPSVSPGSEWARKMTAHSGRRCSALSPKFGRIGSLQRMLLESSILWSSTACYLTWKKQVTPLGRSYFRLAPSTPRTGATGFGLLPTAQAQNSKGIKAEYCVTKGGAKLYDARTGRPVQSSLEQLGKIGLLPTPTAQDAANNGGASQYQRNSLPLNAQIGGALNPCFVEAMMGYPENWTQVDETVAPA